MEEKLESLFKYLRLFGLSDQQVRIRVELTMPPPEGLYAGTFFQFAWMRQDTLVSNSRKKLVQWRHLVQGGRYDNQLAMVRNKQTRLFSQASSSSLDCLQIKKGLGFWVYFNELAQLIF